MRICRLVNLGDDKYFYGIFQPPLAETGHMV